MHEALPSSADAPALCSLLQARAHALSQLRGLLLPGRLALLRQGARSQPRRLAGCRCSPALLLELGLRSANAQTRGPR
jgi:hypothetical protein